jgi:hypothetical protein
MPADTKVTPINKNKAKAADAEPELTHEELPERPAFVSRPHLGFALVGLAVLMWFVYRYVGTLQVMGTGFIGTLLGGLILAAICYVIALIVTHLLHLHHRPLLAWIGRGIASGCRSLGSGVEKLLTGSYVWLERLAPVMLAAIAGWFGQRFGKQDQQDQQDDPDAIKDHDDDELLARLYNAIMDAWHPSGFELDDLVRTSAAQFTAYVGKETTAGVMDNASAASDSLSAAYGDRVLVGSGNLRRTGIHLRLSGLPEDNEPADAPAPAETAAEPDGTADRTTDGDPMTTDAPARRTSAMFGGRTPFPEARALINLIEDANPADGDESDHHDLVLGLGATMFRLAQAWESYCERCSSASVRLGDGAMKAADQVAEALTDVAEDLKKASDEFDSYYDGAHEHLAADKTLPRDGDFLTAEGSGN